MSKQEEKLKLWVRAGGRCEFCNKYLMEDEYTSHQVFLGEDAHIVGRKENGPRGKDPLPIKDRDDADNLMLLCTEHHHGIIDNGKLLPEYPKEKLLQMKKDHEDRIRSLTNLGPDRQTAVLCMTGKIRGDAVCISREEIRKAVVSTGRYPKHFGVENVININLTGLSQESDWEGSIGKIDDVLVRQIFPAIENKEINHLSILALSRIPLLVYLGHKLGDKISAEIFQKHRAGDEGWIWQNDDCVNFEVKNLAKREDKTGVILILSLSGIITIDMLPPQIKDKYDVYEICPVDCPPGRGALPSQFSLDAFRNQYQKFLRFIEDQYKEANSIHLIPAIPAPVAVTCGRELMKSVSKSLMVYDREGDDYNLTIKIN